MTVLEALGHGRAQALRKADIARRVGLTTRKVEKEIERLRKLGVATICSDSLVGYWLPLTPEEYAANLEHRRSRAINQLITNRGERDALETWRARLAAPSVTPKQEAIWP